jgi:hypothetical protein
VLLLLKVLADSEFDWGLAKRGNPNTQCAGNQVGSDIKWVQP